MTTHVLLWQCGRLYHAEQQIRTAIQKLRDGSFDSKTSDGVRLLGKAISAAKRKADEENSTVYMSRVPTPQELSQIVPAVMAKVQPFDPKVDLGEVDDIFKQIVPECVSKAAIEFKDKLDEFVKELKTDFACKSDMARATLASLGLPASIQVFRTQSSTHPRVVLWSTHPQPSWSIPRLT